MKTDHTNMPGMGDTAKKPEPEKVTAPPRKAPEPKTPDPSPQPDKNKKP